MNYKRIPYPNSSVFYVAFKPKVSIEEQAKFLLEDVHSGEYMCFEQFGQVLNKSGKALVGYTDVISQRTDSTELRELYLNDLEHLFNLWPGSFERVQKDYRKVAFYVVNYKKIPYRLLLGYLNAIKAIGEWPDAVITYYHLKERYPQLNFYQRLLLCHVCGDPNIVNMNSRLTGHHNLYDPNVLKHVKNINLQALIAHWKKTGAYNDPSFSGKSWYGLPRNQSSNYQFIPEDNQTDTYRCRKVPLTDEFIKEMT